MTHPHLEGLIRMLGILMGSQQQCDENGQMIAVSRQALDELAAMIQALAALPGGGVDEAMVDRMIARYVELEPSEVENATKDHPATRAFCRELLTAALPTPNPHEADQ